MLNKTALGVKKCKDSPGYRHVQQNCPTQWNHQRCWLCGRRGHLQKTVGSREMSRVSQSGPQASVTVGPDNTKFNLITVAVMRINSTVVTGLLGGVSMEMMLDSGSAVSLVRKDMISPQMNNVAHIPLPLVKLPYGANF